MAVVPLAVLGVLLANVAVQLGDPASEIERRLLMIGLGVLGLVGIVRTAVIVGAIAYWVLDRESISHGSANELAAVRSIRTATGTG